MFSILCILCFCIVSPFIYSCLFPTFLQVYWPLSPSGNPFAVNKNHNTSYHIMYHIIIISYMCMGALVKWYWQGKLTCCERNLSQCHFVHHKPYTDRPPMRGWWQKTNAFSISFFFTLCSPNTLSVAFEIHPGLWVDVVSLNNTLYLVLWCCMFQTFC